MWMSCVLCITTHICRISSLPIQICALEILESEFFLLKCVTSSDQWLPSFLATLLNRIRIKLLRDDKPCYCMAKANEHERSNTLGGMCTRRQTDSAERAFDVPPLDQLYSCSLVLSPGVHARI